MAENKKSNTKTQQQTAKVNGKDTAPTNGEAFQKNGQTNGHAAENTGSFRLQNQYIKDLSFECPQPPAHLGSYKNNMQLDVGVESRPSQNPQVEQSDENTPAQTHEVTLVLRGHNKTEDDKTVYFLEMKYSGLFALDGIPDEHVHGLLGVEAPALLYPFARQLFMSTVGSSGFQPPMLEPINFAAMYMQQQQQKGQQEQQAQQ